MIPIFKNTEDALAYGKLVGGDQEKICEMSREYQKVKAEAKVLQDYEKNYQKAMDLACQSQFIREALEEASLEKYQSK